MKNKQILVALVIISLNSHIKAIDPLSLALSAGSSIVAKIVFDQAKEYYYAEENRNKQTLKKHLISNDFRSAIVDGCNENFTSDCTQFAQALQAMEKYYAEYNLTSYLMQAKDVLKKDNNNITNPIVTDKIEFDNPLTIEWSYFQSLPLSEQKDLLELHRKLVITHTQSKNYRQELENFHIIFNERNKTRQ